MQFVKKQELINKEMENKKFTYDEYIKWQNEPSLLVKEIIKSIKINFTKSKTFLNGKFVCYKIIEVMTNDFDAYIEAFKLCGYTIKYSKKSNDKYDFKVNAKFIRF